MIFDRDFTKPSIARYFIIKARIIRNGNTEGAFLLSQIIIPISVSAMAPLSGV